MSISLDAAVAYFIEPLALEMMKRHGQNRVTIFNIACREAFKLNDNSEYAEALRESVYILDSTGILED